MFFVESKEVLYFEMEKPPARMQAAFPCVRKMFLYMDNMGNADFYASSKPVKATIRLMQLSPSVNFQGKQPITQRWLLNLSISPPKPSAWIASYGWQNNWICMA